MKRKGILFWSSGKDSAWTLHKVRQRDDLEIVALVTTFNEAFGRVAMHGVRMELVESQALQTRLPLWRVPLPWPCSNAIYEERMRGVIQRARTEGVTCFVYGDLFLEEIRAYRIQQLQGTGIEPLFPVWGTSEDTPALAREMINAGFRATLTCVDPRQLSSSFVGREFDDKLLADLPATVDPCGERGEFHTFCYAGPVFDHAIPVQVGEIVERDGFCFADLL